MSIAEMILGHRGHAVTAPANVDACHPSHYLSHFTAEDWGTRFACKKFIFIFIECWCTFLFSSIANK